MERNYSVLNSSPTKEELELRLVLPENLKPSNACLEACEKPYIVVSPGSAWATKRWSSTGFNSVIRSLERKGFSVVVVGTRNEHRICEQVCSQTSAKNLAGNTSLQELCWVISNSSGVLCNDSLNLHIASAFKVPSVVTFCATSPKFGFGPWRNESLIVEREDLPCKPCARHGGNFCPTGTRLCMDGLQSKKVLESCLKLFR